YQWLKYEDTAISRTQAASDGTVGHLSVGFIGSAGYGHMPKLVGAFRERYPQVHLQLIEMNTKDQIEHLKSRYLDIGLLRLPLPEASIALETRPYKRDRLVAALHRDHPLARETAIDLRQLADNPFVAF